MPGRQIEIQATDGGAFGAYVALPASGSGPGLVVLQEIFGVNDYVRSLCDFYAEEGYVAVAPDLFWRIAPGIELGYSEADFQRALGYLGQFDQDKAAADIAATVTAVRALKEQVGKVGAVGYCLGGKLAYLAAARAGVDVAVSYYGVGIEQALAEAERVRCPMVFHFGAEDAHVPPEATAAIRKAFAGRTNAVFYDYAGCGHAFAAPERPSFNKQARNLAHTRTIAALKGEMGPHYDLSALWDYHVWTEFVERDVELTLPTMVADAYVNHVPTLTGGVGQAMLKRFYKYHFINNMPKDAQLIPVSRTVGADRVVEEVVLSFTHDEEIDWLLPGLKPTRKRAQVAVVAVVCFRGDKLYHEHIYWDQASLLVQLGVLDPKGLPIAGADTALKVLDEQRPANQLMPSWPSSANKPT